MLRPRPSLGLITLLAATLALPASGTSTAASTPGKSTRKAAAKSKPAPAAEVPPVPAPPPTLEQMPPVPPQVTYRNGELSIAAKNSTLAQVLRAVQTQTGATVEMPAGADSERVVGTLGPGKPQSVLASLLDGCKYNYIILGSADKPNALQKIILLTKTAGPANEPVQQANSRVLPPTPAAEPPEDEYPQPEPDVEVPVQQGIPAVENPPQEVTPPGGRTPEQMLLELQRMQQQQQQMQQQLNPGNQQQPFGQPFIAPSQPPNQGGPPDQ